MEAAFAAEAGLYFCQKKVQGSSSLLKNGSVPVQDPIMMIVFYVCEDVVFGAGRICGNA